MPLLRRPLELSLLFAAVAMVIGIQLTLDLLMVALPLPANLADEVLAPGQLLAQLL